jgi:hypothetical protein
MGVVYRAEHLDTGERVALKTVQVASSSLLASIRREIHALERLRHPGVVRILEQGVSDGLPWYAMELLQGHTLRSHLEALWSRPPSPERRLPCPPLTSTLTLLRRLCAPLSFLHGNGLVHCDLKPENIFIRATGVPVLVDLGIAARFGGGRGRESLEVGGEVQGSAAYMAPEQVRGSFVDARADLYALGCILYEVLTGRPPFWDVREGSLFFQHLRRLPPSPSQLVEGIPEPLERLVLRLLAKHPSERLGYADDVAAVLGTLGAEPSPEEEPSRPQAYLYRPELSGRGDMLHGLWQRLEALEQGQGGRLLLLGESGVGKTRLATELATEAARRGLTVVTGECLALEAGVSGVPAPPLHPLRPLLLLVADRCRERSELERLGPKGRVLAAHEPALAVLPGMDAWPEPPPLPPQAARTRLFAALRDTLVGLAEQQPVLLVIDDLQWADELTLAFLQELPDGALEERGVLLIATCRAEEIEAPQQALLRQAGWANLELARLDTASVGEMVCGMLALREPPRRFVDFLVHQSNGNPFFIAEYLRTAIVEQVLLRNGQGEWQLVPQGQQPRSLEESLPLPRSIAELMDRRLQGLEEQERALVELAAVLGREFEEELLLAEAVGEEAPGLEALEALRLRQLFEEAEAGRLRFVHDKLRELAYARMGAAPRRALHWKAAQALDRRHGEAPEWASTLALHWSRAQEHERASRSFARAGAHARAAYAHGEAVSLYRSALEEMQRLLEGGAPPAPWRRERLHLHEALGELLSSGGQQEEARASFTHALALCPAEERLTRVRLLRKVGKTWELHHRHEEAVGAYAAAEEALGPRPAESSSMREAVRAWWQEWVAVQMECMAVHYWQAQTGALAERVQRTRPVVEAHGTPGQRAHFFQALIQMNLRRERYLPSAETVGYARAYLAASEEVGEAAQIATARFGLATTLVLHGALEEALEPLRAALQRAERLGEVPLQVRCLTFLTQLHRRRGEREAARHSAERALALAREAGMVDYVAAARSNLAWLAWCARSLSEAEQGIVEALELWRPLPLAYPFQWMALLPLMALRLEVGRGAEALDAVRALLDERQQRLPEELTAALAQALEASREPNGMAASLARAIELAGRMGYL